MKNETRRNVRVTCGAPASAEGPRGPIRGVCRDLSIGGMFFVGIALPVGRSVDFEVQLPGGAVACRAEVRYHHSYREVPGMGVRFTRIAQEDLSRIERYVARAA